MQLYRLLHLRLHLRQRVPQFLLVGAKELLLALSMVNYTRKLLDVFPKVSRPIHRSNRKKVTEREISTQTVAFRPVADFPIVIRCTVHHGGGNRKKADRRAVRT